MEYYSATKKNEISPFTIKDLQIFQILEGIMLNEISQRKTNIIWLHSYEDCKMLNR